MEIDLFSLSTIADGLGVYSISDEQYNELLNKSYFKKYLIDENWIAELCMDKNKIPYLVVFSSYVSVKYKLFDIDTDEASIVLEYKLGTEIKEKHFDSEILTKFGVKIILKSGIRFLERYTDSLIDYLIKSDSIAKMKFSFSKLGWCVSPLGELIFKGYKAFGSTQPMLYGGNLDLTPTGKLKKWVCLVKDEIINNIPLSFVLCLGFSSPVLQFLNLTHDLGSIFFNIVQDSSKGKSTSEMLAISVFANPKLNDGTLITYNGTDNAISDYISSCQGFTVGLDEVGMNNTSNFPKLLYVLTSGRSKLRLNGDSSQKEVKRYSSVIVSTGEYNIIQEDTPLGLKARVFELKNQMTSSAESSDIIKKTIIQNYGLAGEIFIEYLLTKITEIEKDYEKEFDHLLSHCKKENKLTKRIFSKLAVISLSAKYANDALNLELNLSEIKKYILKLENEISTEKTPEEFLIDVIQKDVVLHGNKYSYNSTSEFDKGYGAIRHRNDGYVEVCLTENSFFRIVNMHNISNWKNILHNLRDIGILITEGDRLTKRLKIINYLPKQKCYCFKLIEDVDEIVNENSCVSKPNNDLRDTNKSSDDEPFYQEDLSFDVTNY